MITLAFTDGTSMTIQSEKSLARVEWDGHVIEWGMVLKHAKVPCPLPVPEDRQRFLRMPIGEADISVRSENCLRNTMSGHWNVWAPLPGRDEVCTMRDLCLKTEEELLRVKNFGRKSLDELKDLLERFGLSLGMTEDQLHQIEERA